MIYLGQNSQGEYIKILKILWSGTVLELCDAIPDVIWYSTLNEIDEFNPAENISSKAKALGITPEFYVALQTLGKGEEQC